MNTEVLRLLQLVKAWVLGGSSIAMALAYCISCSGYSALLNVVRSIWRWSWRMASIAVGVDSCAEVAVRLNLRKPLGDEGW